MGSGAGLVDRTRAVARILSLLSDDSNRVTYVHCTAGRDRASVISAITLNAIGVPHKAVVEDYALTDGTDPESMENMLAAIDDEYGSSATYVRDLEHGEAILEGLKRKLLA